MSTRTRTLLLTGCFFVTGLFAPPPLVRLGASDPAPSPGAADVAARVAGAPVEALLELAPSARAGFTCARR